MAPFSNLQPNLVQPIDPRRFVLDDEDATFVNDIGLALKDDLSKQRSNVYFSSHPDRAIEN